MNPMDSKFSRYANETSLLNVGVSDLDENDLLFKTESILDFMQANTVIFSQDEKYLCYALAAYCEWPDSTLIPSNLTHLPVMRTEGKQPREAVEASKKSLGKCSSFLLF